METIFRQGQSVYWLRLIHTRTGTDVKRIAAVYICGDKTWSTVEVDGQRMVTMTADLRVRVTRCAS